MPTFSIQRPSKIHPNWDIWSEIKPSGNPVWNHGEENQAFKNRVGRNCAVQL
jgi:hypothetical protein